MELEGKFKNLKKEKKKKKIPGRLGSKSLRLSGLENRMNVDRGV